MFRFLVVLLLTSNAFAAELTQSQKDYLERLKAAHQPFVLLQSPSGRPVLVLGERHVKYNEERLLALEGA